MPPVFCPVLMLMLAFMSCPCAHVCVTLNGYLLCLFFCFVLVLALSLHTWTRLWGLCPTHIWQYNVVRRLLIMEEQRWVIKTVHHCFINFVQLWWSNNRLSTIVGTRIIFIGWKTMSTIYNMVLRPHSQVASASVAKQRCYPILTTDETFFVQFTKYGNNTGRNSTL